MYIPHVVQPPPPQKKSWITFLPSFYHKVRLVEGSSPSEGRVEVFANGAWGTVCDDDWDLKDAAVICRQLGFPGAESALRYAAFGRGDEGQGILLDDVKCNGHEVTVFLCPHSGVGIHSCGHYEDAGVRCALQNGKGSPWYNTFSFQPVPSHLVILIVLFSFFPWHSVFFTPLCTYMHFT